MDFEWSPKVKDLVSRVTDFRNNHIYPNEQLFAQQTSDAQDCWKAGTGTQELTTKSTKRKVMEPFVSDKRYGLGLSNLEYAPIAEVMGCNEWAPEVFNWNPPDSGNMGILAAYANEEQKDRWLRPLLDGEIHSCFAMTEPGVASSDATNISATATRSGDEWAINGNKWFISGPANPLCRIAIVMCRTNSGSDRHKQHSMILVPLDTPGLVIERQLTILGFDFAPRGHPTYVQECQSSRGERAVKAGKGLRNRSRSAWSRSSSSRDAMRRCSGTSVGTNVPQKPLAGCLRKTVGGFGWQFGINCGFQNGDQSSTRTRSEYGSSARHRWFGSRTSRDFTDKGSGAANGLRRRRSRDPAAWGSRLVARYASCCALRAVAIAEDC